MSGQHKQKEQRTAPPSLSSSSPEVSPMLCRLARRFTLQQRRPNERPGPCLPARLPASSRLPHDRGIPGMTSAKAFKFHNPSHLYVYYLSPGPDLGYFLGLDLPSPLQYRHPIWRPPKLSSIVPSVCEGGEERRVECFVFVCGQTTDGRRGRDARRRRTGRDGGAEGK